MEALHREYGGDSMKVKIIDKQTGEWWIGEISIVKPRALIGVKGFYYPHENGCEGSCYSLGGCGALWQNPDDEYDRLLKFFMANLSGRERQKLTIRIENASAPDHIIREIESLSKVKMV
jgi:hypothetical protein